MPASPSSFDSSNLRSPLMVPTEKNNEVVVEKLSIDEMLQKHCGEFGKWQLKHFVLANLAWTFYAFHVMVMPFADRVPEWRCVGGGCGGGRSVCDLRAGEWEWIGGRGGSTVSEWGLICGDKFKVGLVQSIFFAGSMIGAGIFGHLSDSFLGRKGSLTVACALNGIFGCITAFSPNYSIYAILRLLTGFSSGGVGLCAFVLATEPIGPTKRGSAGMSTFYFFSSGIALVSLVAYIFQTWRHLYIAASIPSLLYLIFVIPFLSESPRWYLVRGRVIEATNIMASIASSNGRHLPRGVFLALDEEVSINNKKEENNDDEEELLLVEDKVAQIGSILDVIRFPVTRTRLLVAIVLNFVGALVYYGISLNVANLETNLYMNVALNAIAEMPAFGITAVLLERFGRKPLTIGTMWFSGFFCLLGSLMRNVGIWKTVRMVCGILGIFGMAGTYNLLFIYTAELFPTVVRNAALGCTNQAAEMGAILAPIVVVLGGWLPFAVFAVSGIVGGAFAFLLPETHNQPLYDTFAGLVGASV